MQKQLYLPQTIGNISVPINSSQWTNNEKKIILSISDGIFVDENAQVRGIASIPDIWARPLMFQSALRINSKHPLRKRFIGEWRGLLSLLALHKIKPNLSDLKIIPVLLDDGFFSTALRNLSPKDVKLEEKQTYSWTDILLIKFGDIPLGAFSPTTLVYTSANYNEKLKDKAISLKDDGYLCPPTKKEDGLEYIGEWVYNLKKHFKEILDGDKDNPDNSNIQMISSLIDEWLIDIKKNLEITENDQLDSGKVKISESLLELKPVPNFISKYQVYQQLLKPLEKEEGGEGDKSDISLKWERNKPNYKEIIIITEQTLIGNARIWDEQRVNEFGSEPSKIIERYFKESSGTKIDQEDLEKAGGLWIRPELYFLTDSIVKAKGGNFLNEKELELNGSGKYIFPFKKEILNFFSPEYIKKELNPTFKDEGSSIKFSFTLPLLSGKDARIEKIYRHKSSSKNEGTIYESDVPVLEIFPDFFSNNWRKYFLFQGKVEELIFEPVFFEKNIKIDYREHEEFDLAYRQKIRITEIVGDNSFPEGIVIINRKDLKNLGVIMLKKTPSSDAKGLTGKWTIGIDFGTSNTNVYRNKGGDTNAEKWLFNFPQYFRKVTDSNLELRKHLLEEFLIPDEEIELPIPTTLRIFHNACVKKLFLDYSIYFPNKKKFRLPDNVLSDIKWKAKDEIKTDIFFESLLFFILLTIINERILEIEIRCSYPKAFSDDDKKIFKGYWENVLEKLIDNKESSRLIDTYDEDNSTKRYNIKISDKPKYGTEGIAAGEYFANPLTIHDINERANKEIAALCLDVGGGTTDISIWYENKIIFDASVLVSGRQISQFIQKNSRIKEYLFSPDAALALNEKKNEPTIFAARLNLILKQEEKDIHKMLIKHANQKEIQWIRQMIAIEFGALAYYVAEICVAIDNEKMGIRLLNRIRDAGINLHWGGNAAKFIGWIDFGKFDKNDRAANILNSAYFNCLCDEEALKEKAIKAKSLGQFESPDHKSESAGGLVVMNSNGLDIDKPVSKIEPIPRKKEDSDSLALVSGIVSGEQIELIDKEINAFELITKKDLFDGNRTKFKSTSLDRLNSFIEIINYLLLKAGLLNEDTKVSLNESEKQIIKDTVLSEFIKSANLEEGKRTIEPIFIMEIKVLFEILNSRPR